MGDDEHRAITAAGPDVILVPRKDMLALLDERTRLKQDNRHMQVSMVADRYLFAGLGFMAAVALMLLKSWVVG